MHHVVGCASRHARALHTQVRTRIAAHKRTAETLYKAALLWLDSAGGGRRVPASHLGARGTTCHPTDMGGVGGREISWRIWADSSRIFCAFRRSLMSLRTQSVPRDMLALYTRSTHKNRCTQAHCRNTKAALLWLDSAGGGRRVPASHLGARGTTCHQRCDACGPSYRTFEPSQALKGPFTHVSSNTRSVASQSKSKCFHPRRVANSSLPCSPRQKRWQRSTHAATQVQCKLSQARPTQLATSD